MAKEPKIENRLVQEAVGFDYVESVLLSEIVNDKEAALNIRLTGHVHEWRVDQYGQSMKAGDAFPAIVLYRRTDGRFGIIDGIHRIKSSERVGKKTTDAYIVHLDPTQEMNTIKRLRHVLNTMNGEPYSQEETVLHALALMDENGLAKADAARQMRLNPRILQLRLDKNRTDRRFRKAGIEPDTSKVPETSRRQLARIKPDVYFKQAHTLASVSRMNGDQVKEIVADFDASQSDQERDMIIRHWTEKVAPNVRASAGGTIKPPTTAIRNLVSQVQRTEVLTTKADLRTSAKTAGADDLNNYAMTIGKNIRSLIAFYRYLLSIGATPTEHARVMKDIVAFEKVG